MLRIRRQTIRRGSSAITFTEYTRDGRTNANKTDSFQSRLENDNIIIRGDIYYIIALLPLKLHLARMNELHRARRDIERKRTEIERALTANGDPRSAAANDGRREKTEKFRSSPPPRVRMPVRSCGRARARSGQLGLFNCY